MADPWHKLALAILVQAARDARHGSSGARTWLRTSGVDFAGMAGVDLPDRFFHDWIDKLPKRKCKHDTKNPTTEA